MAAHRPIRAICIERICLIDSSIKFDVIHVGAAPEKVPKPLVEQLADGGVIVIPVGGEHETQKFMRI